MGSSREALEVVRDLLASVHTTVGLEEHTLGYVVYKDGEYDASTCTSFFSFPGVNLVNHGLLGALYFVALLYIFLGIFLMTEPFLAAIEKIVSAKVTRTRVESDGRIVSIQQDWWNPTVANITMLGVGTSAPVLALVVIGAIVTLDDEPDELGPASVVGAGAFNFCFILAACLAAHPSGEPKNIIRPGVYCIALTFSLLAFIWMYIVLSVSSPNVVEVWEACVTLLLFGLHMILSFGQDMGWPRRWRTAPLRWCAMLLGKRSFAKRVDAAAAVKDGAEQDSSQQTHNTSSSVSRHSRVGGDCGEQEVSSASLVAHGRLMRQREGTSLHRPHTRFVHHVGEEPEWLLMEELAQLREAKENKVRCCGCLRNFR